MKKLVILLIGGALIFLASQGCISTSTVVVSDSKFFPTVTGTDLHGDEQTFPDCLSKDRTILVVAFERWQQKLCDEWYVHIEKLLNENENVAYYEVPTIAEMNPFTRWFIYQGMRGGIKEANMRSQVVTLHIDKQPFKKSLGIDTEKTVHVYVVDKDGKILEYVSGEWSEDKWGKITAKTKE